MARILVAMYNFIRSDDDNILPPYYQTFIEGLRDLGNHILCSYHKEYNKDFNKKIPDSFLEKIKKFDPEIAIFFNNEFYDITNILDIPIVIYDVDSPLYTRNIDKIKQNKNRYKILTIQQSNVTAFADILKTSRSNIGYIIPFTGVKNNSNIPTLYNISFVGANWLWDGFQIAPKFNKTVNDPSDRIIALKNLNKFILNPTQAITERERYKSTKAKLFSNLKESSNRLSGIRRARYLTAVADLGLELRGLYWDHGSMAYFPELSLCFNPSPIYSLKDNELLYNSSKLSININHIQAVSGFSWRVCDILASNACLITEEKSDLTKLFGRRIPTFTTTNELRDWALRLLASDNERQDIVSYSHELIDKSFRFRNAVSYLEELIQSSLHCSELGSIIYHYDKEEMPNLNQFQRKHMEFFEKLEKRLVNFKSALILDKQKRKNYRNSEKLKITNKYSTKNIKRLQWYLSQQNLISKRQEVFKEKPKTNIRVAFLVIFDSVFPAENVFRLMLNNNKFDPYIIVIPDTSRGVEHLRKTYFKTINSLKEKYSSRVLDSYSDLCCDYLDFTNRFDIFCSANPYDNMTHLFYRASYIHKKGKLQFYLNYGYPAVKYGREIFSKQFTSLQWKYFIETEDLIDEYREHEIIKGRNVEIVGYPKMDTYADYDNHANNHDRKTIIIAPHHTIQQIGVLKLSNFMSYSELFLELPKKYPNIDFIFRPHPLLFQTLKQAEFWGDSKTQEYLDKMLSYSNVQYEDGGDYLATFAKADGIIHDCSSFTAEWLFTGKRGCYLLKTQEVAQQQFMPFGLRLLDFYHKAFCEEDIHEYIKDVLLNKDPLKTVRINFVNNSLRINYPRASEKVIDLIESSFF